ncbi:MAG: glutathione S-transferase N-terminal domain-containing protein [Nevskiales bacterium]
MRNKSVYEPFKAYVMDLSYFSGKMEAMLRYKEVPFERIEAGSNELLHPIYTHTGLMKVPVVECANGEWLKDTTPMLYWFDQQYPAQSIIPQDPVSHFICRLVEDYADEWLWRPALYYRWNFAQDRRLLGDRIAREVLSGWPFPGITGWYFAQRQKAVNIKGDGVRPHNEEHVVDTYLNNLNNLELILQTTPYLTGSHPSLVDFGYFASMFRHFGLDPTPARIMRKQAPAVYEWLARLWNAKVSRMPQEQKIGDFSHSGWDWVLGDIVQTYLPYLADNALAWQESRKRFDFELPHVRYPQLPVSQYRTWCRGELQRAYAALTDSERQQVKTRFGSVDLDSLLQIHGIVTSGLEDEFALPLKRTPKRAKGWKRIKLSLTGTPQDMPDD